MFRHVQLEVLTKFKLVVEGECGDFSPAICEAA